LKGALYFTKEEKKPDEQSGVVVNKKHSAQSVKIQNRGPEQEIPAVTCMRLIAQKHRY